MEMEKLTTKIK